MCRAIANAALSVAAAPRQLVVLRAGHRRRAGVGLSAGNEGGGRLVRAPARRGARRAGRRADGRLGVAASARRRVGTVPWRMLDALRLRSSRLSGGGIVVALVGDGPYVARSARFEPGAVLRVFADRGTRLATLGYLGHMWELYAVWTWIAAFAAAALYPALALAAAPASRGGSFVAFVMIASGAIGSAAARFRPTATGRRALRGSRWLSARRAAPQPGSCSGCRGRCSASLRSSGASRSSPIQPQLSALVAEFSPRDHVGTALTVQTCAGFLLTMVSIRLTPAMVGSSASWQGSSRRRGSAASRSPSWRPSSPGRSSCSPRNASSRTPACGLSSCR